ncbi:MAG: helix-turn-helix transcriptional regulator [Phycisphaerales bacterium]|nr:MAG: helix-turn-helix transcriptional regulator [Phycisphaerales bacterium]
MSKALEHLQQLDEEFERSAEGYGFQLRLDFAEILWRTLNQLGWTQTQFAERSGWSDSFVSNLVHANQNCELDTIGKALHTLGVKAQLRMIQETHLDQSEGIAEGITETQAASTTTPEEWRYGDESQETQCTLKFRGSETNAPNEDAFFERSVCGGDYSPDVSGRKVAVG